MLPRLCVHKSKTSPRWFVRINGHRIYLGPWSGEKTPSKAIQAQYKASIRQLLDPSASPIPQAVVLGADLTILEAAVAFIADQLKQHGKKAEDNADFALRPVVALFGRTPAKDFGPLRLRSVREHLVNIGRTRSGVNKQINAIKRAWRWMAELEMIPGGTVEAHRTMRGLRYGQTEARESTPKAKVTVEMAEMTAARACPIIAAMIRVQVLTGLRPGEVCRMTTGQLDQADPGCWFYRPDQFKTKWLGKNRAVPIGPRAQEILLPFLHPQQPDRALFSPIEATAHRMADLRSKRKSKVQPSQLDRRKENLEKTPGEFYITESYGRAIKAVNITHDLPAWSPSCLRATRAQTVFESLGLDAARTLLGHADEAVTLKFYLHQAEEKSKALALLVG
ncbi:MAG: site-specific integrase [Planctomycetota bacterium]|nr:site-specific integrase [Planctomycetota bacterium]